MAPKKPRSAFRRVVSLLTAKDRRNLSIVFVVSLLTSVIDVLGVGSIAPFIAVASNPAVIHSNPYLKQTFEVLRFTEDLQFLVFLGLVVIAFLVFTSAFKALSRFVIVRFTSQARHRLSMKLMEGYLRQDYPFFLNRNSHEFVKNVTGELQTTVQGTLMTTVEMVGFVLQITLFIILLMTTNPWTTLSAAAIVSVVYALIYLGLRKTVKRLGQNRFDFNRDRNRVVSETFWGIKETKVLGAEMSFLGQYESPSSKLAINDSQAELAGDIPKFALEAVAFSSIIVFVLVITVQAGGFQEAAATIGLFAFASYRMIPAMQNLFKALNKMRYTSPAAEKICQEFDEVSRSKGTIGPVDERMAFTRSLVLREVSFVYPQTDKAVLKGLSLEIPRHQTIGFAGPTGSGKTTLIDMVLGLLEPTSGVLTVDGVELTPGNKRSWQAIMGYVPQNIYLSNSSIAQNIAFGVDPDQIDLAQVEKAARMAQIHGVVADLPDGYKTEVGERGVRLSGGQRQRLGIARALYRNPEVLVFDEATSALDNETEAAVMEAVHALSGQLTVLLIAHRLSTLRECNTIYLLEAGVIKDRGTFGELAERHQWRTNE